MPTPPRTNRRVAVVIEASNAYARGLLTGILRHVREHDPWTVFLPEHGRGTPPLEALATWVGDGVIARPPDGGDARALMGDASKDQDIGRACRSGCDRERQ